MNKKVDIKYLGIPNICFSLTHKEDEREEDFIQQRITRGFDDSETWSLRDTIAEFIIPRLERYEEIAKDFLERDEELIFKINELLEAFKMMEKEDNDVLTKEEYSRMYKGLDYFGEVFMSLWW